MQGGVLGWVEVAALWAVYQTQQLSSFLITPTITSLGGTPEVLYPPAGGVSFAQCKDQTRK